MADNVDTKTSSSSFLTKLRALPMVEDSISKATDLYQKTQDYKGVGVAVNIAEGGIKAATKMLPLAAPLLRPVGGWQTVDLWATQGLDKLQTWAPIITLPTTEVLGNLKGKVMKAVAGDASEDSLATAFSNRAEKTVLLLKEYQSGKALVDMATVLVDATHTLVDTYLPPAEGDLNESDGRDGSLVIKSSALALKVNHRLHRTAHTFIHPDAACTDFSTLHIIKVAGTSAQDWVKALMQEVKLEEVTLARFATSLVLHTAHKIAVALNALLNVLQHPPSATQMMDALNIYSNNVSERLKALYALFFQYLKDLLKEVKAATTLLAYYDSLKRAVKTQKEEA
ncbi:perilipin-2-like [Cherax quadricarinatus]